MLVDSASKIDKATLTRWLLQNSDQWIDLYDTEYIDNRLLRRGTKGLLYFWPELLVRLRVTQRNLWPEVMALLGLSALECNDLEMAMLAFNWLMENAGDDYYWGLPIKWHSAENVFPPGTMMSTTTAEVVWFLLELDRRYQCVGHEDLERIGFTLASNLHRAIDDGDRLQFAYTPYPGTPVNNSNILVASALWGIGCHTRTADLMTMAKRTLLTCLEGLDPSGGITYCRGYGIIDSYHQLFSIRALYTMKDMDPIVHKWFERTLDYFERTFIDSHGGVLVRTDRAFYSMISSAEALRLYRMIGASDKYHSVLRHIHRDLTHRGRFAQKAWPTPVGIVHSRAIFTRQGLARLAVGLEP
jgi:hypothetical protein